MRVSASAGLVLAVLLAATTAIGSAAMGQPAVAPPGMDPPGIGALPAIRPTRDVAVEYQAQGRPGASGPAQSGLIRVFWGDRGARARVEMAGMPTWGIINLARARMIVVFAQQHGYVELPLDPNSIPGLSIPPGTKMTRVGSATVAGFGCTVWQVRGPGDAGTACITEDGLVLQAQGHGQEHGLSGNGTLRAVMVRYGPQPAALFEPPAGFTRIDLPHIDLGPPGPAR